MNIINQRYDNTQHNLAIVIYPPLELKHATMEARMTEYTLFYAKRFNQLVGPNQHISIYTATSIDQAMEQYSTQHSHILFMAAGVRIFDMTVLFDIISEIEANPNYLAAAHILDWGPQWYELHQQFVLVNSSNWLKAGRPSFGGWEPETTLLPTIERSPENFHDGYTPLWIRSTGTTQPTYHSHPGWNYIRAAATHGMTIINWPQNIRLKRTYYYPEDHPNEFLQSLATLQHCGITNRNQLTLVTQLGNVRDQIWLLNSEDMRLPSYHYDTIALTASGFKFLEVFKENLLNDGGQLIIYDFNPHSLAWIKLLHTHRGSIVDIMAQFSHPHLFKILGGDVYSNTGPTQYFYQSLEDTIAHFGGLESFNLLLEQFRRHTVLFVEANLYDQPHTLTNHFSGNTLVNVSNIFCTDFSNAYYGMSETHRRWNNLIASLPTITHIVGHDSHCAPIDKVFLGAWGVFIFSLGSSKRVGNTFCS